MGENLIDDRVWITKSHFPERVFFAHQTINKAVVIVRNPLDAIFSKFNFDVTHTHDTSISDRSMAKYADLFDEFVKENVRVWREFHSYWMEGRPDIPVYILRFEDVLSHPKETMTKVMKFLLNSADISGTMIDQLVQKEMVEVPQIYKPRSGKANKNLDKYTDAQVKFIK